MLEIVSVSETVVLKTGMMEKKQNNSLHQWFITISQKLTITALV
jgi:hypothetical protein